MFPHATDVAGCEGADQVFTRGGLNRVVAIGIGNHAADEFAIMARVQQTHQRVRHWLAIGGYLAGDSLAEIRLGDGEACLFQRGVGVCSHGAINPFSTESIDFRLCPEKVLGLDFTVGRAVFIAGHASITHAAEGAYCTVGQFKALKESVICVNHSVTIKVQEFLQPHFSS